MAAEQRVSPQQLATGLGWFSIGLGLAEIIKPDFVANLVGVTDDSKTRKVLGSTERANWPLDLASFPSPIHPVGFGRELPEMYSTYRRFARR